MQRVLPILAGAGFTAAVSTAAGLILIRRLRVELDRTEEVLFGFISGSAVVSLLVFFLCVFHQARLPVFLAGGAALAAGAYFSPKTSFSAKWRFGTQKWLFLTLICPVFVVYLLYSLAPEVSPDGSGYHLGNVTRMWQNHGFVWDYHSIYSYLSQGIEMLYLVAFSIGGMPAAATFHLCFLVVLGLLIACYGRRFGFPRAGMFAAVLVFASPVVGLVGSSAYNDVALATCIYAVFYLLQVHGHKSSNNLLIFSGLIAGFCYAVKYPGGIVLPFAVIFLRGKGITRFLPAAALMMVPWLVRNWWWVGNPFAPFLNRWFPNPFYSPEAEASYLRGLRVVEGFQHWWQVPFDLTIYGARLPGFLGPIFLLTPLILLTLRWPQGRKLTFAAVVFAIPVILNPGARFLIPAIPFIALGLSIAIRNSPGVIPLLAAFHVFLSFPWIMHTYCASWAWRVQEVPARVALGRAPEIPYIEKYLSGFWLKKTLEEYSSKSQKIYSIVGIPEAYVDRRVIVSYESLEGLRATRALESPRELKALGFDLIVVNHNLNSSGLTPIEKRDELRLYRVD